MPFFNSFFLKVFPGFLLKEDEIYSLFKVEFFFEYWNWNPYLYLGFFLLGDSRHL